MPVLAVIDQVPEDGIETCKRALWVPVELPDLRYTHREPLLQELAVIYTVFADLAPLEAFMVKVL